jgi:signal peptidase complex subunit 3
MHTTYSRLNALWSIAFTAMAACAATMAATDYADAWLNPAVPTGTLTASPTPIATLDAAHPLDPSHSHVVHRSVVYLNIGADFRPCFNWNTKQVFVYAIAEYVNDKFRRNEVTVWDHIITSADDALVNVTKSAKYFFDDHGPNMKQGGKVKVVLRYHTMCHSGATISGVVQGAKATYVAAMQPRRAPTQ